MFALRAYQAYGNDTWLEAAQTISVNNTLYWDQTCGGGVLWLTYRPKIKNTITNACATLPASLRSAALTFKTSLPQTVLFHARSAVSIHGRLPVLSVRDEYAQLVAHLGL